MSLLLSSLIPRIKRSRLRVREHDRVERRRMILEAPPRIRDPLCFAGWYQPLTPDKDLTTVTVQFSLQLTCVSIDLGSCLLFNSKEAISLDDFNGDHCCLTLRAAFAPSSSGAISRISRHELIMHWPSSVDRKWHHCRCYSVHKYFRGVCGSWQAFRTPA